MKILLWIGVLGLSFGALAFAYEGPAPLKNIAIKTATTLDISKGIYRYSYTVTNPSANDGEVISFDVFLGRDPQKDTVPTPEGLTHCATYMKRTSEKNYNELPIVAVGSSGPSGWICGYGNLKGYSSGTYGWGADDEPFSIKPGDSKSFVLTSRGVPGIRDVLIEPNIDNDRLPDEYQGDVDKIVALKDKVKWMGKTIGPKAPPKVFDGGNFIAYLIELVNQSRTQGWIDNDGIVNSLLAKLNTAQSKVGTDKATTKNVLGAFMNDVKAQNGKHLTSEAYALLYFNAQYAVNHL